MTCFELFTRAIAEFFTEHARMSVREKLDQVYATEPSTMDPALARAPAAAIAREEW